MLKINKCVIRLRQATGQLQDPFGGINIILCGDTKQLSPIGEIALWAETLSKDDLVKNGQLLFKTFQIIINLTEIMRQRDDTQEQFRQTLLRIRTCEATVEDYDLLKTRILGIAPNTKEIIESNPVYLVPTKQMANEHNFSQIVALTKNPEIKICTINAVHNSPNAAKKSDKEFQNLSNSIQICKGARVMVTANLWVNKGIMNGAFGTVRYIIYETGLTPPCMPIAVILEMDSNYTGPTISGLPPRHIVLNPKTNYFQCGKERLERTQFPIILAYAITIHKCQGN